MVDIVLGYGIERGISRKLKRNFYPQNLAELFARQLGGKITKITYWWLDVAIKLT